MFGGRIGPGEQSDGRGGLAGEAGDWCYSCGRCYLFHRVRPQHMGEKSDVASRHRLEPSVWLGVAKVGF
jgi:hypothetical protein